MATEMRRLPRAHWLGRCRSSGPARKRSGTAVPAHAVAHSRMVKARTAQVRGAVRHLLEAYATCASPKLVGNLAL